jgi:hypothetical protein
MRRAIAMEQDEGVGIEGRVTLAWSQNGEPIEVPAEATGWRVRRHRAGSPPEVVYSKGRPLVLPIDGGVEELASRVGRPGRYRLDAVDESGRSLKVAPAFVVIDGSDMGSGAELTPTAPSGETGRLLSSIEQLARTNAEVVQAMVGQLSSCITAAGGLLVPVSRQRNGIIEIIQPAAPTDGAQPPPEWMGFVMGMMPAIQQLLGMCGQWLAAQKAQASATAGTEVTP